MNEYPILQDVSSPEKLKKLGHDELGALCDEIRRYLVKTVMQTGGHLASNLGIVEISVALLYALDTKTDKIIYDVGHQCYVHKLLTGRLADFETLRSYNGLSGFPWPEESSYDHFVSGHASTSISVALGFARAARLSDSDACAVAVIGDGALTGGMAYEALNDAGVGEVPLIVILNDNGMSINKNVGAVSRYLSHFRLKKRYLSAKMTYHRILDAIPFGKWLNKVLSSLKTHFKHIFIQDTMFDHMGFEYLGLVNGHDVSQLIHAIEYAKTLNRPVLIHAMTTKGKGDFPAEHEPGIYHGVPRGGQNRNEKSKTWSDAFGEALTKLADENTDICAVTAAMKSGTGLAAFARRHPDRFFDVGIAEEHAVTMSAAMAAGGKHPFFTVYSTFLQRGFDQIIHDVSILGLPVTFAIDRAGLCGEDGVTHHGIYDIGFLSLVRGIVLYAPSNYEELDEAVNICARSVGPSALRYPRGCEGLFTINTFKLHNDSVILSRGKDLTIIAYGKMIERAIVVSDSLRKCGIFCEVIKLNRLIPLPTERILTSVEATQRMVAIEECVSAGCIGSQLLAEFAKAGLTMKLVRLFNCGDGFITHGSTDELEKQLGIDEQTIIKTILEDMQISKVQKGYSHG